MERIYCHNNAYFIIENCDEDYYMMYCVALVISERLRRAGALCSKARDSFLQRDLFMCTLWYEFLVFVSVRLSVLLST